MKETAYILECSDLFLSLQPGPVASPPVVDMSSLCVMEEGGLPSGTYYYAITAMGVNGESAPYNLLKIRAPYKAGNTISLMWKRVNNCTVYKVYRGTEKHQFDGSIVFYSQRHEFNEIVDTGYIELDPTKDTPPDYTALAEPPYVIRKDEIIKIDGSYYKSNDGSVVSSRVYISTKRSMIDINLLGVLNKPEWCQGKQGNSRAIRELEQWWQYGKK